MLIKLAKNGMKGRLTDYFTLFSGLSVSVAVMYLFLTLAVNRSFLTENSVINSIQMVFVVGAVLLAIITFFYVLFAHSFLLSLRKKEFGAYLLMGVKRRQLKKIARIELLVVAVCSNMAGLILGVMLSLLVSRLLTSQMSLELTGFQAFYLPAMGFTLLYYVLAFSLSALWQHRKLMKTPILDFLYAELRSDDTVQKKKRTVATSVFAVLFLIIGYLALIFMEQLREIGLLTATISTTVGTYLLFTSLLPVVVEKMKQSKQWRLIGLNTFTFSQLQFRMKELKYVLATVAMLIALSAGAISAAFAFLNNATLTAEEIAYYDIKLFNPTEEEYAILDTIPLTQKATYHVKMDEEVFYYSLKELAENPPLIKDEITYERRPATGLTADMVFETDEWGQQRHPSEWYGALYQITPSAFKWTHLLPDEAYQQLPETAYEIVVAKVDDFLTYETQLQALDALQKTKYELFGEDRYYYQSKYNSYQEYYAVASGTFFMGFFLGIAFLMMMASVLMFKVLSNAHRDVRRYVMLDKMGVKKKTLIRSLQKELGLLFLFPAIIGVSHVLIGMNLFSFILLHPYDKLWVSLLLFVFIYLIYFLITFAMYKKIVLPKTKARH